MYKTYCYFSVFLAENQRFEGSDRDPGSSSSRDSALAQGAPHTAPANARHGLRYDQRRRRAGHRGMVSRRSVFLFRLSIEYSIL